MWRGDMGSCPDLSSETNVGKATLAPKGYHTVLGGVKQLPTEHKPQKGYIFQEKGCRQAGCSAFTDQYPQPLESHAPGYRKFRWDCPWSADAGRLLGHT